MELTERQWQAAIKHTTPANHPNAYSRAAPNVVMLALGALVGDTEEIVASHTEYRWDAPTLWRTWAFVASGLAHVQAEFAPDSYDAHEDRQRRQRGSIDKPVEPTTLIGWVRPLETVTSFRLVQGYHHFWVNPVGREEEFVALEFELQFGNESERIGIGSRFDDEAKRDRWEAFVAAARQSALGKV